MECRSARLRRDPSAHRARIRQERTQADTDAGALAHESRSRRYRQVHLPSWRGQGDRRDRDCAVARSGHARTRAGCDRRLRQHVGADRAVHPGTHTGEGVAGAVAVDRARTRLHRELHFAPARGVTAAEFILALVTAQRGTELLLSRRNTQRLMARGAVEVAPRHYPLMVAVHACWLIALWLFGHDESVNPL